VCEEILTQLASSPNVVALKKELGLGVLPSSSLLQPGGSKHACREGCEPFLGGRAIDQTNAQS
jgi:hypothetical protein